MITIEQVEQDIKSGKSKVVYYSSATLWWTHLDSDLKESSKLGREAQIRKYENFIKNPEIPDAEKKRFKGLMEHVKNNDVTPLDPSGAPLMMITDNPIIWIDKARKKPTHFGEHQLEAFMKAHAQNCEGKCFRGWDFYNLAINQQNKQS